MLRKFIIICLVISTFGYGVAWAFDAHSGILETQAHQANSEIPASGDHDDSNCDHCCHASAHFLGIAASANKGLSASCRNYSPAVTTTLVSFLVIPASPPPKR